MPSISIIVDRKTFWMVAKIVANIVINCKIGMDHLQAMSVHAYVQVKLSNLNKGPYKNTFLEEIM